MTTHVLSELEALKRQVAEAKAEYESGKKSPEDQKAYIEKLTALTTRMHDYADSAEESAKERRDRLEKAKEELKKSHSKMWELNRKIALSKSSKQITKGKK